MSFEVKTSHPYSSLPTSESAPQKRGRSWLSKPTIALSLLCSAILLYAFSPTIFDRPSNDLVSDAAEGSYSWAGKTPGEDNPLKKIPHCPSTEPLGPEGKVFKNVWRSLTIDEAVSVRQFVTSQEQLNITAGSARMSDNFIELIETFHPPKAIALAYYNGSIDAPPARSARVVITFGGVKEPHVRNYLVSPVPVTSDTSIRPLDEIYHRPIIPHNARGLSPHDDIFEIMKGFGDGLEKVTPTLLGGVMRGLPNDTITVAGSGPWSFDGTWRRSWLQYKKNIAGDFLNTLNLYQYIDMSGTDSSLWKTLKIVYNKQIFGSKEEFVQAFENGTLRIDKDPPLPQEDWSSRHRHGEPRDLEHLPGPRQVSFDGLRFRVDKEQHSVSWLGWEFYLGFDRDMGLSLWNIRFLGDRIVYELAPQEAIAQYTGDDPHQSTTAWLDRYFGMGARVFEMVPNYDCPPEAVYLPSLVHGSLGSTYNPRAICIFEKDLHRPLTRHRGTKDGESGATKAYALVVRSVSTVGNYDYIFDYTFMLDGTMEVRVSASGYLQGAYWDPTQDQHGTRVNLRAMGTLHDHIINYKVDFDVVDSANTLLEKTMQVRNVEYDWLDDDWGSTIQQQYLKSRYITNEDESRLKYHQNLQGAFGIINQDQKNAWGVPRGYAILPGFSTVFNTVAGSKRMLKNADFAKHNLAVSLRKETEISSSSAWNHHLPGAPPVEFDRFFDGENIEQEDIVAWINLGMHHITQSEDIPHTRSNTASSSFVLSPLNFHDRDVSIDMLNSIMLTERADSELWNVEEYGVEQQFCLPPIPNKVSYGHEKAYDTNGKPIEGNPGWIAGFRSREFPHALENYFHS